MTAMLIALLGHLREHGRPPVTWYFISTCDEELGCLGARHLMESGFRCDGMIVGEPTSLRPVGAHKGAVRHEVDIRGIAAHSSTPARGANAVHAAADFILMGERAVAALDGPPYAGEPGGPTFSAGIIHGGSQVNRIPDRALVETDFRLPPGMQAAEAEHLLQSAGRHIMQQRPGITFAFRRTQEYPSFELPGGSPFRSVIAPLLGRGWNEPARYATNAGIFGAAGIPCVVYGPGDIAQAHTSDEWIAIDQVGEAVTALRQCIETAR
jgi:acetylornithine deacetylase